MIVATFLGTMGLPHVLVRFYTNPDGRAARRTALVVIALLSAVLPVPDAVSVCFARLYVPQLLITGTTDAAVLLLPRRRSRAAPGNCWRRWRRPVRSRPSWPPRRVCW